MASPTLHAPTQTTALPAGFDFDMALLQARAMLCMIQDCAEGEQLPDGGTRRDDESIYQSLCVVEDLLKDAYQDASMSMDPSSAIVQMIRRALGLTRVVLSSFIPETEAYSAKITQSYGCERSSHAIWALETYLEKVVAARSVEATPKETPTPQRH